MRRLTCVLATVLAVTVGCGGGDSGSDGAGPRPDGWTAVDVPHYGNDTPLPRDSMDPDASLPEDPGATPDSGPTDPGTGWQDSGGTVDSGTVDPGGYDPGGWDPGVIDLGPDTGAGGCDPCGYGAIAGVTCAPNAKTALPYVKVWLDTFDCNGSPVHIQTYSDAQGNYRLENVPCGTQTVFMKKGSFEHAFVRWVDKGMTTVATSGDACLPKTALRIAVIVDDWDKIEVVLRQLWFQYKWFDGHVPEGSSTKPEGAKLLAGEEAKDGYKGEKFKLMDDFDVVFINCGPGNDPIMNNFGSAISPVLRDFVAQGGSIYASDYASVYVYKTWPAAWVGSFPHDFPGSTGAPRKVTATIVDSELAAYMGKATATIEYRLGPLTSIVGTPGAGTQVHLEGPNSAYGNAVQPFMISFQPNGIDAGRVIYTNFHNEEQALDPAQLSDMAEVLQYIVFLM